MTLAAAMRSSYRLLRRLLRKADAGRRAGTSPPIAALGLIGDRATAAVVTTGGEICWYCPGRFDAPSLFGSRLAARGSRLAARGSRLDPDTGGEWRIDLPGVEPGRRRYLGRSTVLETALRHPAGSFALTAWMALDESGAHGTICRRLGPAPANGFHGRQRHGRRTPPGSPSGCLHRSGA